MRYNVSIQTSKIRKVNHMEQDILRFPVDQFTTEEKTVKTRSGQVTVAYRKYEHLQYVAKPVDAEYQSLDVWAPTAIDGKPYDASNAPIFFAIDVGGYMSSSNFRGFGPPGVPAAPAAPAAPVVPAVPAARAVHPTAAIWALAARKAPATPRLWRWPMALW